MSSERLAAVTITSSRVAFCAIAGAASAVATAIATADLEAIAGVALFLSVIG
jgi:hypothetical protein